MDVGGVGFHATFQLFHQLVYSWENVELHNLQNHKLSHC